MKKISMAVLTLTAVGTLMVSATSAFAFMGSEKAALVLETQKPVPVLSIDVCGCLLSMRVKPVILRVSGMTNGEQIKDFLRKGLVQVYQDFPGRIVLITATSITVKAGTGRINAWVEQN